MIQATFIIGAIITVSVLVISLIITKVTPKTSYIGYFPGFISFGAGLILLLFATIFDRIWLAGAGLGGWGIACVFAGAIGMMITALFDTFRQSHT